jgi:hypothetical protein
MPSQVTSSASPGYPVNNLAPSKGVFTGNPGSLDSAAQILAAILGIDQGLVTRLDERLVTGLDKSDDGPGTAGTLTAVPENGTEGSWSYTPTGSALLPTHLLVKAGSYFTVWAFDAATQGYWSTEGIVVSGDNQPELSHLTALAVTPVPAAAWLLAPALLGLAGLQRRQRRAKA